jgi:hypothetical protein
MNADANGQSSAALWISVTPDPRSSPSNWRPAPDTQARSPRDSSELSVAERDRRRRYKRRADLLLIDADHRMRARVKHPDGGERTVADTQADEKAQREKITRETGMGSHKHDRLPRWQRWIPKFVVLFGFVLLLYLFAGITNVDWQSPMSMNLPFTGALAAMVTVLSYGFLAFTGLRFRSYKSHDGAPDLHELDGLTKAASGAALAVIAVLAVLMYLRMHSQVLNALGGQAGETASVIPLSVAVISAVANCLVVLIYAFDGSDEVARLDKLAAATRRPARKAHQLRRQAAQQTRR